MELVSIPPHLIRRGVNPALEHSKSADVRIVELPDFLKYASRDLLERAASAVSRRRVGVLPSEDADKVLLSVLSEASRGTWVQKALLILAEHPDISVTELARTLDVSRETVSRNPTIKMARGGKRPQRLPEGSKTADGRVEAISPADEEGEDTGDEQQKEGTKEEEGDNRE